MRHLMQSGFYCEIILFFLPQSKDTFHGGRDVGLDEDDLVLSRTMPWLFPIRRDIATYFTTA